MSARASGIRRARSSSTSWRGVSGRASAGAAAHVIELHRLVGEVEATGARVGAGGQLDDIPAGGVDQVRLVALIVAVGAEDDPLAVGGPGGVGLVGFGVAGGVGGEGEHGDARDGVHEVTHFGREPAPDLGGGRRDGEHAEEQGSAEKEVEEAGGFHG